MNEQPEERKRSKEGKWERGKGIGKERRSERAHVTDHRKREGEENPGGEKEKERGEVGKTQRDERERKRSQVSLSHTDHNKSVQRDRVGEREKGGKTEKDREWE